MMPEPPPNHPGGPAPAAWRAPGVVALVSLLLLGGWWAVRAREHRDLTASLGAYASTPLPAAGDPVDLVLADLGARVFEARCAGCHHMTGEPRMGPNLRGITLARDPAWLRGMIMTPDSMTRHDPIARALLEHYDVRMMVAGGMDGSATRAVMEFLRRADGGGEGG